MVTPSLSDESDLLGELDALAAAGRYRELLDRLTQLGPPLVAGRTRIALLAAEAHGRLGAYPEAERWAAVAHELARSHGEPHAELRARNYQAAIALGRGDLDDAEQHFGAVLEMARSLHDDAAQARGLNNLGIIAFLRGDPKAALAMYQLALAAYQRAGLLRGMVETHHNIGISRRELGDHRGALEAADQAVRLALSGKDDTLIGLVLTGRAEIRLAMRDAAHAEAELRAAERAYERVKFRRGLAEVWRVQGGVARARGDHAGAVQRLRDAAALATEQGSAEVLSAIERDLGGALDGVGDRVGARAAWQRALEIFRRLGAAKEIATLTALVSRP